MLRQKDIRHINELVENSIEDWHSDYGMEYLMPLVIKYENRVIAFKINTRYDTCKVLLEGNRKYFFINLCLKSNTVRRVFDLKEACTDDMIITNIYEYDIFKKVLLIDNLNPKCL